MIDKKKYSNKKYSLYNRETGKVVGIKEGYLDEGHPPTICGDHAVLANMVNDFNIDPVIKTLLLERIDIVYDMGKRMGEKLVEYHKKYKIDGKWREGY